MVLRRYTGKRPQGYPVGELMIKLLDVNQESQSTSGHGIEYSRSISLFSSALSSSYLRERFEEIRFFERILGGT